MHQTCLTIDFFYLISLPWCHKLATCKFIRLPSLKVLVTRYMFSFPYQASVKKLKDHGNIVRTLPSAIIIEVMHTWTEIKQCHLNYLFSCLLLIFYGSCLPNLDHEVLCTINKMVSVVVKQFRRSFLSHHLAFLKCVREAYSYSCISMVTELGG